MDSRAVHEAGLWATTRDPILRSSRMYAAALAASTEAAYEALTGSKKYIQFTAAESAGRHAESWNRCRLTQRVLNWLDVTIAAS